MCNLLDTTDEGQKRTPSKSESRWEATLDAYCNQQVRHVAALQRNKGKAFHEYTKKDALLRQSYGNGGHVEVINWISDLVSLTRFAYFLSFRPISSLDYIDLDDSLVDILRKKITRAFYSTNWRSAPIRYFWVIEGQGCYQPRRNLHVHGLVSYPFNQDKVYKLVGASEATLYESVIQKVIQHPIGGRQVFWDVRVEPVIDQMPLVDYLCKQIGKPTIEDLWIIPQASTILKEFANSKKLLSSQDCAADLDR